MRDGLNELSGCGLDFGYDQINYGNTLAFPKKNWWVSSDVWVGVQRCLKKLVDVRRCLRCFASLLFAPLRGRLERIVRPRSRVGADVRSRESRPLGALRRATTRRLGLPNTPREDPKAAAPVRVMLTPSSCALDLDQ
jgi:hypothetical protein